MSEAAKRANVIPALRYRDAAGGDRISVPRRRLL
jgi:hypothetical protein